MSQPVSALRPPSEFAIRAIPKAEVHVHLEGGFELADLFELAKAIERPLPISALAQFGVQTQWSGSEDGDSGGSGGGLSAFLEFLDEECGLVRTTEQAARHAYRFAARETSSGVRYADVIINPTHWGAWRDRLSDLFDALSRGFLEAEQDGLATVNLCVSLLRQQTAAEGAELAEWVIENRPDRVVALSIDGNEQAAGRTGGRFARAFTIARDGGLHRTVHAGESSGPEGVWDAIRLLHAERIDHGVRAIEDADLVAHLAESEISLGVCPRSNFMLGLYQDWGDHPVAALRDAGVRVTINTDDPALMGIRLESEWALCAAAFGWDFADLHELAIASVEASFAPAEFKQTLRTEIAHSLAVSER
jgi:adenosine deaminase